MIQNYITRSQNDMNFEEAIIFHIIKCNHKILNYSFKITCNKSKEKSIKIRSAGNSLFIKKKHERNDHELIWELYTLSIATAEIDSEELACGYANRSAILKHFGKYEECMKDIDNALKITTSNALRVKLLCRKSRCSLILQNDKQRNFLEKAKYWFNKIDGMEQNKIAKLIESIEETLNKEIHPVLKPKKKYKVQCANDTFSVSYLEKFGKCLIASRDIKPGEFIFMENSYVVAHKKSKTYAYCSHCLSITWTAIPCNNCYFYMYCSEDCKSTAWQKYHYIECFLNMPVYFPKSYLIHLSMKSLILALNEVGGINNLKHVVNNINKNGDKKITDFVNNKNIDHFSFLYYFSLDYSLMNSIDEFDLLINYAHTCILATVHLFQTTECKKLFNGNNQYFTDESLRNKYTCFIGSLLLKLVLIYKQNSFLVSDYNKYCRHRHHPFNCPCVRGACMTPFCSFINHSCNSNIDRFIDNNGKIFYYALHPIKKNSQLLINYHLNYYEEEKVIRQRNLLHIFGFICNCIPCENNWNCRNDTFLEIYNKCRQKSTKLNLLFLKNLEFIQNLYSHRKECSEKEFLAFKKDIDILFKKIIQPNDAIIIIVQALKMLIHKYYGNKIKISKKCKY